MGNHTKGYKNSDNSPRVIVSILIVPKELNFDVSHHDKEISDTKTVKSTQNWRRISFSHLNYYF